MIYFTEEKEVKRDYANTTQGPVGGDTGRGRQKNYYKKHFPSPRKVGAVSKISPFEIK